MKLCISIAGLADKMGKCCVWQRAKLLDARESDRKYLLEYTVQKPEEDEPRHFLSAVSLGFNGRWVSVPLSTLCITPSGSLAGALSVCH